MDMRKAAMFLANVLKAAVLFTLLGSSANAEWYRVKAYQVVPRADTGDVFVQFRPGETETRFTGLARGVLFNSQPGANKIMAVLLTSIALNAEISIEVANTPSFTPAQVITGTGLVAP